MAVSLDRMAVDDVVRDPARIVAEIHRQLGEIPPPIPVHEIAHALDIVDIREQPLRNFEAALITTGERNSGSVLLNRSSSPQRRRYSLGHELGHFLCDWHRPTEGNGFQCTQFDMTEPKGGEFHIRQEKEANQFAIELLAPKRFFLRFLHRVPELEHVLSLHSTLDISKAAAVRRYVSLHPECLAAVFARGGVFEYAVRGEGFPWVNFEKGDRLPALPRAGGDAKTSEMVEADSRHWIRSTGSAELAVQLLSQEDDYSIILLHLAGGADEDDDR